MVNEDNLESITEKSFIDRFRERVGNQLLEYLDSVHEHGGLYKTTRIGLNGKEFNMYKIRTFDESGTKKDGWVYRFMRKTGIDEIPQLVNIVKGDIRVVGLRALDVEEHNNLPDDLKYARKEFASLINVQYCYDVPTYDKFSQEYVNNRNDMERLWLIQYNARPLITQIKSVYTIAKKILTNKLDGIWWNI